MSRRNKIMVGFAIKCTIWIKHCTHHIQWAIFDTRSVISFWNDKSKIPNQIEIFIQQADFFHKIIRSNPESNSSTSHTYLVNTSISLQIRQKIILVPNRFFKWFQILHPDLLVPKNRIDFARTDYLIIVHRKQFIYYASIWDIFHHHIHSPILTFISTFWLSDTSTQGEERGGC